MIVLIEERLSDIIPDREQGLTEKIVIELPTRVNSTAGRGLIIHDLFFAVFAALALTIGIDVACLSSYPTHGTLKVT